jgi:enterobacterial common antigen flippase
MKPSGPSADEALVTQPTDLAARMLWVTAAMGFSAGLVLVLAAVRNKLVAVDLGPAGVGSLALLVSFISFASVIAELGIGNGAVREIAAAEAEHNEDERDAFRRALRLSALVLGLFGAVFVAVAAGPIARSVLQQPDLVEETRLSSVAVGAGVLSAAAMGELRGFRRVRALAVLPGLAGLIGTAATLVAFAGGINLLPVVIIVPAASLAALAWVALTGLPRLRRRQPEELASRVRKLVALGLAFTLNTGIAALGALLLRLLIDRRLGTADTGEFQAAFTIASSSVGFLFAALATDYMPLLSSLAHDSARLNRAANTQLRVAMLVSAPGIAVLIAAAPTIVALLYSSAFHETARLLRIMLLGDLLRLAAWTLGYILIARRAKRLFVATELLYNTVLIAVTAFMIPQLGLEATAVGYLGAQVASLAWTLAFVRSASGFRVTASNLAYLGGILTILLTIYVCATAGGLLQAAAWAAVVGCSYAAVRQICAMAGLSLSGLRRLGLRGAIAAARRSV